MVNKDILLQMNGIKAGQYVDNALLSLMQKAEKEALKGGEEAYQQVELIYEVSTNDDILGWCENIFRQVEETKEGPTDLEDGYDFEMIATKKEWTKGELYDGPHNPIDAIPLEMFLTGGLVDEAKPGDRVRLQVTFLGPEEDDESGEG